MQLLLDITWETLLSAATLLIAYYLKYIFKKYGP